MKQTLPHITEKQQEIIRLIPRFKYLSRLHIQIILNHKEKRRINKWLKLLKNLQLIEEVSADPVSETDSSFHKNFGQHNTPLVYRLGIQGIRWLKHYGMENGPDENGKLFIDPKLIHTLYIQKDRTVEFAQNSLLLADIYTNLLKQQRTDNKITLNFYTKTDYSSSHSHYFFLHNMLQNFSDSNTANITINPDAYILKQKGTGRKNNYLLHIIPNSMLRFRS